MSASQADGPSVRSTAGNFTHYSNAFLGLTKGLYNLSADTYVLALLTGSYVPAPNADTTWANISANEVASGLGYTTGGLALTGTSDTLTGAIVTFSAANPSWANFSATHRYGVVVRRAGGSLAGTDLLYAFSDLGGGSNVTFGAPSTYTVQFSASGIMQYSHTP